MRRLMLAVAVILVVPGPATAAPDYDSLVRSLTDKVIVPAYHRMTGKMSTLAIRSEAFCAQPGKETFEKTKKAFNEAMEAWQRVQPVAFGPVTENGRTARIEYWPDRRGTGARQLRAALQARDPKLIAVDGLEGKSVALQSLSAFETLLFEHGLRVTTGEASEADRYACELAAAIARFQSQLATQIMAEWMQPDGFREAMLTAAQGNTRFANAMEAATAILKSLVASLDQIVRDKLEAPLGESQADARPRRAESWRSEQSLNNIAANLAMVRDLYDCENAFGELLAAAGAKPLDAGMRKGFTGVVDMARRIELPLHQAVRVPADRARVAALLAEVKSLRSLMSGPVAHELGLMVGFNAQDGD